MSVANYEDRSYPPVGTSLNYRRGDGAQVSLSIQGTPQPSGNSPVIATPVAAPATPATAPAATKPRPKITYFDLDDATPPTPPTPPVTAQPAIPLAPPLSLINNTTFTPPAATTAIVAPADDQIFDNPAVGGKFTIFVLLYGPPKYHSLHQRCVNAIVSTMPKNRLDLRIGSNELCNESVRFVDDLIAAGTVTKHYRHLTNDRKYPVMREMFYDPDLPITTKWLMWFDDDSIADRNPNWLRILAEQIAKFPQAAMFGGKLTWPLDTHQANHYKSRPWYKGKAFRDKGGRPATNGNVVHFAHGGCWALRVDAMQACNIPDPALGHNGGDYTIGEQLYQGGFILNSWNSQKQFIHTSSVPRRGLSEKHFGKA